MPLATPAQYAEIVDSAKAGGHGIPAVSVSFSTTLNAAILGFVTAGSDGIVHSALGRSQTTVPPSPSRSRSWSSPDGDHCPPADLDSLSFLRPLLVDSHERRRRWGRSAEQAMAARVVEACPQLGSAGRSLTGQAPRPRRA